MAVNSVSGATYPTSVKQFTTKVDFQDLILAEHVNTLQLEVKALQSALGTAPTVTSGWVGTFDQTTTEWSTLRDRLANLEVGLGAIYSRLTGGGSGALTTADGTQTLTNKTLTAPAITGATLSGTTTNSGTVSGGTVNATTLQQGGVGVVTVSGSQTLTGKTLTTPVISQISNTGTVTLPTATTTLVGRDTTDTLTNKTLTSPTINTPTLSGGTVNPSSLQQNGVAAATVSDPQTLTNKTMSGASNTFSAIPSTAVMVGSQTITQYVDSAVAGSSASAGEKISSLMLMGA